MKPRIAGYVLVGLVVLVLGVRFLLGRAFATGGAPAGAVEKIVVSKDGTRIAYEQTGSGPPIVLVSGAMTDRDGTRPLARLLAPSFTVINYDRRGRGRSGNTLPYAPEREVEDIEALAGPGPVVLFGSSSGAVLAFDAAARLGARVSRVVVFEPPFIVDGSFPPIAESLAEEVATQAASGDGDGAAALFFGKGMGIPAPGIWFMRCMLPAWGDMTRIAGTAAYDLRILHGTQAGKPLPAGRWTGVTAPVVVAVGGKSEPFFHSGGQAAAKVFREARFVSLDGLDHSAVLMAPEAIAALIRR